MDWNKLKPREKKAILLLGAAAFLGIYVKFIDRPIAKQVAVYKTQIARSEAQLRDLEMKKPQDADIARKISTLEEEGNELTQELADFESQVPSRLYTSQLVGEFTRLAKEVKLESVKQRVVKEQTYSRILLEVKFYSTYLDAVKYIAAIESISPYLRVDEFEILEPVEKTVELGGAPVRLVVSCLLSDSEKSSKLQAAAVEEITLKRDILASRSKPTEVMGDSKFVLEGITFDKNNPTAIINGDVFAVNSKLGGYVVKEILADSVVLSDGVESHLLSLNPVTETTK